MTERLYYTRDDLKAEAQVLSCHHETDGTYSVVLNQTLFHPQGGGQPADTGWINDIPVIGVTQRAGEICHLVQSPIAAGPVTLQVDGATRQLHTRLHSAGHLIGHAGELLGWQPVKAHHWPGEARITFERQDTASTPPDAQALQQQIVGWVGENLPRIIAFDQGQREIQFAGLAAYGCGGTHVAATGEIGPIEIGTVKVKKGLLTVAYTVKPADMGL